MQLAWNVEAAVSPSSSIIKAHNRADWTAAARAFELYCKAKGRWMPACGPAASARRPNTWPHHRRRRTGQFCRPERAAVDAESPFTASKIQPRQRGSGATAALTGASQVLMPSTPSKTALPAWARGWCPWPATIVLACASIKVWERIDMRRRGVV